MNDWVNAEFLLLSSFLTSVSYLQLLVLLLLLLLK